MLAAHVPQLQGTRSQLSWNPLTKMKFRYKRFRLQDPNLYKNWTLSKAEQVVMKLHIIFQSLQDHSRESVGYDDPLYVLQAGIPQYVKSWMLSIQIPNTGASF